MTQYPANINLSSLDGVTGFALNGEGPFDSAGFSVSSAGDVNGDGFDDMIIGARDQTTGMVGGGAAYVVFGKASGFAASLNLNTLNGTNGFKIGGAAGNDYVGNSVSSAGDVNGDGFADLIIGAPHVDTNGDDSGAAYVVFGKANGFAASTNVSALNGTNGFTINGVAGGDYAGFSVSAGDVNGDGFSDLIIGAKLASPHGTYSGATYVVFGKASGLGSDIELSALNGTNGFKLSGTTAADKAGTSVSSAGDVNGDGYDDLIIGAPGVTTGPDRSGSSYLVFGKASGFAANINLSALNGTTGFKITGVADSDLSGHAVSKAGDVNADGYADLIVGSEEAAGDAPHSGVAYVIFGKASGFSANLDLSSLNGTNGFKITGVGVYDLAGVSVAAAGDVNGDGFDDIIIGAYGAPNGALTGAAYVVFGKLNGFAPTIDLASLTGVNGFKLPGTATADYAGWSVSSAGDVNGDGLYDMFVGADHADAHGQTSGSGYVVLGKLPDAAVNRTGTLIGQHLVGGNFADVLTGGGGDDKFWGYGGNDLLTGGSGNDIFNGGTGVDTVSYANATAGVHVSLLLSTSQNTVGAGHDTLISIEKIVGSLYADTLIANTTGATLNGGGGGDDLVSGPGSDILNGGGASDFADYSLAASGVTVSLAVTTFQNTGGGGNDELVGIEKLVGSNFNDHLTGDGGVNTLFGEAGDDVIVGGDGGDYIYGNAGIDSITGGAGQDNMTGGAGADTFIFTATSDSPKGTPDLILDFTHGLDKIDLSAIDADTGTAGNQAFHLGGGGGHAGDITATYNGGTGQTAVDFWTGTHAPADGEILLSGDLHATLAAGDFVL